MSSDQDTQRPAARSEEACAQATSAKITPSDVSVQRSSRMDGCFQISWPLATTVYFVFLILILEERPRSTSFYSYQQQYESYT